jgi:hypothetical protein
MVSTTLAAQAAPPSSRRMASARVVCCQAANQSTWASSSGGSRTGISADRWPTWSPGCLGTGARSPGLAMATMRMTAPGIQVPGGGNLPRPRPLLPRRDWP